MIRFLQTPGPTKKIILGGLLLLICVSMLIYLIPNSGGSFGGGESRRGIVASIAGEEITTQTVQREARQMLQQQYPRGGAEVSMLMPYFAARAAENLISQKAILAEAERLGMRATDEEVRDEIQHGRYAPIFFPGGTFIGQEEYQAKLQTADLTIPVFEQSVKEQLLFTKLRELVTGAATVSGSEIHREFVHQTTKVKFAYALLQRDDLLKSIHPAEAELKAYYERNKQLYNNSLPEKRKLRYALLDRGQVEAQVQLTPDDFRTYYDQHRDEFREPEQVNVRQILIKTPLQGPDGKVDPKETEAARKKADDVYAQLKAGAKFEDLAKKYSEDPTGKEGGSVGWVREFPVPEVNKVAFSLPKGGTSAVINAGYAFVILRVDDKQTAHMKTLEEVKGQIEPLIKAQKTAQTAQMLANNLLNQARSNGFEKTTATRGLQVVNTDFISAADSLPGVGNSPQFSQAIFGGAEKSRPDVVQLAQGIVLYEIVDIKPPATPTFEEIRSRVESEFQNERVNGLLSQKAQELSDRAKAAHDLKKVAKELGATINTSDLVLPDAQLPDIGSMSGPASVVFTMKPGDISAPISTSTGAAVLTVLEKQEPSEQDFAAKQDQIRDSLLLSKQGELFQLFVINLRAQMEKSGKIKVNQTELDSLTKRSQGEGY